MDIGCCLDVGVYIDIWTLILSLISTLTPGYLDIDLDIVWMLISDIYIGILISDIYTDISISDICIDIWRYLDIDTTLI